MNDPIDFLTLDDLLDIARAVVGDYQIRDLGALESAVVRPQTSVLGRDAYPGFAEKVAALLHSIARNHGLVDGNKRLTWAAGRVFCLMNGLDLKLPVDEAERLIVGIADGSLEVQAIADLLNRAIVQQ